MCDNLKETEICTCECHQEPDSMHFMDCCDFTYEQYINENGTFDIVRFAKIFKNRTGNIPSIVTKDTKFYLVHK